MLIALLIGFLIMIGLSLFIIFALSVLCEGANSLGD